MFSNYYYAPIIAKRKEEYSLIFTQCCTRECTLAEKIENFKESYKEDDYKDEKLRKEFIDKFPLEKLPTLELERYALGGKEQDNLCNCAG